MSVSVNSKRYMGVCCGDRGVVSPICVGIWP